MRQFVRACSFLLVGAFFILSAGAQDETQSTQEVIDRIRAIEAFDKAQLDAEVAQGKFSGWFFSKHFDERQRLDKALEVRAANGDSSALFFVGLLADEWGARLARTNILPGEDAKAFAKAADFYRRAGEAGAIGGYWNLAVMYLDGRGVMQSKLAAAEWFYKAGTGYVTTGQREKALAALEAIQRIDKNHVLVRRLQLQLSKSAPK